MIKILGIGENMKKIAFVNYLFPLTLILCSLYDLYLILMGSGLVSGDISAALFQYNRFFLPVLALLPVSMALFVKREGVGRQPLLFALIAVSTLTVLPFHSAKSGIITLAVSGLPEDAAGFWGVMFSLRWLGYAALNFAFCLIHRKNAVLSSIALTFSGVFLARFIYALTEAPRPSYLFTLEYSGDPLSYILQIVWCVCLIILAAIHFYTGGKSSIKQN